MFRYLWILAFAAALQNCSKECEDVGKERVDVIIFNNQIDSIVFEDIAVTKTDEEGQISYTTDWQNLGEMTFQARFYSSGSFETLTFGILNDQQLFINVGSVLNADDAFVCATYQGPSLVWRSAEVWDDLACYAYRYNKCSR